MTEQPITTKKPDEFEDGKELEDYVNELDQLNIEPEPSPEATVRLEDVAAPPVRNEKKKPPAKQPEPPKPATAAKPEAPPQPAPTTPQQAPVQSKPDASVAVTANAPKSKPEPQAPQPEAPKPEPQQPQQLQFNSIDDYLKYNANEIKKQYSQQGEVASQQYLEEAYKRLVAVVKGEVVLVPVDQYRQQTQPQPMTAEKPKEPTVDANQKLVQLELINRAITDPTLKGNMREFIKRKCELLGVEFKESMVPVEAPPSQPVVAPPVQPAPKSSPVDPIVVSDGKKKKSPKKWSLKAAVALVAIAVFAGAAIYVIVGALIH